MDYVLARLTGVDCATVKALLKEHAPVHAGQGMFLQHFWQNTDVAGEVQFLFRVDNLERAKAFIVRNHADARKQNPEANLPQMTYLSET
ncbi:MAG TPA: hypothetical protein VMJ33_00220 [Gallionella sp.]|nr:hypothetical protein [Gallionella sp.]